MTKNTLFFKFSMLFVMFSCFPSKDLIYSQYKNSSNKKTEISQIESKFYRPQVNDVLSISVHAFDNKLVSVFSFEDKARHRSYGNG